MTYDFPDIILRKAHGIGLLRETLCCKSCGASMRDRQMAVGLLLVIAERLGRMETDLASFKRHSTGELNVLDTDSFSSINAVLRGLAGYTYSQYKSDRPGGVTFSDGSMNVNLLEMPFDARTFDVIMTSDVMEHVAEDTRAHKEILRCLAPGGQYIFTVPFDPCLLGNRQLTQSSGLAASPFILEKHLHGDPHSSGGILAHRIYGQQLVSDLDAMGYDTKFIPIEKPENGIFGGDLFIARRKV